MFTELNLEWKKFKSNFGPQIKHLGKNWRPSPWVGSKNPTCFILAGQSGPICLKRVKIKQDQNGSGW